jgi:hypothetical protein
LFYDFLCISQESANLLHYLRICSARRSSEVFDFLQMSPFFAQKPWKENTSCDVFHREAGGVAGQFPAGSPVLVAGQRRRSDPCSPRAQFCGSVGDGKGDGEGARWRPVAVAAGARAPARRRCELSNTRHGKVLWGLGEMVRCFGGGGRVRMGSSLFDPKWQAAVMQGRARRHVQA